MPVRFTIAIGFIVVVTSLTVTGCGGQCCTSTSPTPPNQLECGRALWSADHETGDLSQWYVDGGGGEFNTGAATSRPSLDVAHSGRYSAEMTINASSGSAVRLFRWNESRAHPEADYSAWFYFPRRYTAPVWWNIFSFKSRNGEAVSDAFWQLQIGNRADGAMYPYLTWWGPPVEGPRPGESGPRHFSQSLKDVSVGQWTYLKVYLRQSSAFDGQIVVWHDGVELFNLNNVRTRYPTSNGANEWSVNNYSEMIVPNPTTIYLDDALISTACMGPRSPLAAPPV